ncbi:hypothetical protein H8356DRAFT_1327500 [Neocallimastix lanati (nom. inval.)]|nr:hypothetical protein H8356DRAFT_1327500 [Neocallimastix sp. JGI-2020a]
MFKIQSQNTVQKKSNPISKNIFQNQIRNQNQNQKYFSKSKVFSKSKPNPQSLKSITIHTINQIWVFGFVLFEQSSSIEVLNANNFNTTSTHNYNPKVIQTIINTPNSKNLLVIFLASIASAIADDNQEFLNRSYIDANGSKAGFHAKRSTLITNTNDHVEIAFTDNILNMDWEVRYTMRNDTKGVYFSLKLDHKPNYPDTSIHNPFRLVTMMSPKEACKVKTGEVIHKYDWSIDTLKHDVHGFATKNGLGCAYHRDLACHQGEDDFLTNLCTWQMNIRKRGENWSKVYGPYLIYLNIRQAGSPQASWRDAKSRYVKQRGSVTGKLTIKNPLNNSAFRLEDAVVTLNRFLINNDVIILSGLIVFQGNVIPGTYQLRTWSKGVVGEFILNKSITVTAGRTTTLGEIVFTEKRVGPIALEIGIPDRTAKEFKHGDHFNQWGLPYKFPKEFPNGVNYTIGKSNYARDWNYCYVSIPGRGGASVLRVSVAANSSTALSVSINGGKNSAEVANFKDDACVRRFYLELAFKFEPNDFKVGENKITLRARKTGGYTNNYQFDSIICMIIRT